MQETIRRGKGFRRGARTDAFAVLACAFYVTGCGGDSSGADACAISGCGGDIKGTWDVTAMCVSSSSVSVPSSGVAACDAVERAATNSAKIVPMQMTVTFTDTNYTLTGTAQVALKYVYTKECLTAEVGSGATEGICNALQMQLPNAGLTGTCMLSGETCVCNATETMPLTVQEPYTVDGTKLAVGGKTSPFCVKGDTAQFSPSNAQVGGSFSLKRAAAQTP